MKKFLSFILALTFCFAAFSAFAPSISAKSETISESEAKDLIVKAYDFCMNVRAGRADILERSKKIELVYGENVWEKEHYWQVKEENLPGGSYEKMCEYVETIYTKEIAPKAYAYKWTYRALPSDGMWDELQSFFYRNEEGVLYADTSHLSYRGVNLFPDAETVEIDIVSGDSKTAKANVHVKFFYVDGPRAYNYDIVECRFENTADGWRIAESEYSLALATEALYLEDYRAKNPDAPNPSGGKLLLPDAREVISGVVGEYTYVYNYLAQVRNEMSDTSAVNKYDTIVKEVSCPDGSVREIQYVCLSDLKYGFSQHSLIDYCTDQVSERLWGKVRGDEAVDMFIEQGFLDFVVIPKHVYEFPFIFDRDNLVIEIVESTDQEATAIVYIEMKDGVGTVTTPIECKFEKTYGNSWYLADSPIIDLLVSVKSEDFTQSDAKALIDAAVASRELLSEYYPNHMRYVQGAPFELGYKIDWKELYVPVSGQKFGQLYVTLMDHLLPGGSYEGFLADTRNIFTESVAKRYCSEYYHNNDLGLFMTEDGVRYIAAYTAIVPIGFRYDPEKAVIDMIEVTENTATAKVYCYNYVGIGPDRYDFYVECKFVKTDDGWRIGASDFANMLCSFEDYRYTVINAQQLESELKVLIDKSWDFYNSVIRGRVFEDICDHSQEITVNIDGKDYPYWLLYEEKFPGGSYEEMVEYAKSIYLDNIAEKMYAYPTRHKDDPVIPAFYFADDGKIYTCLTGQDHEFVLLNNYEIFHEDENHPANGIKIGSEDYEIRLLEYTSNSARAYVRVNDLNGEYTNHVWLEVTFAKQDGKWRIHDSSYTDMLRFNAPGAQDWRKEVKEYDGMYSVSPDTGDNAFDTIALCLGGMAVAVSLFCFVRRRREQ